jgi:hypothetical protein
MRACHSECAKLIAKVYEVDSMICARCGSEMRLIAVITDPAEVRNILRIDTFLRAARQVHRIHYSSRKVELATCTKDDGVFQGQATGNGSSPGMLTIAR